MKTAPTALVEIDLAITNHTTVSPMIVITRAPRVGVILRNASIPVNVVSMPPYAFMPIVAARAAAEKKAVIEPRWPTTLLPAVCRPTRPSTAPSRIANHAPSAISQIAGVEAPTNTEAMILPRAVVRGRYRE